MVYKILVYVSLYNWNIRLKGFSVVGGVSYVPLQYISFHEFSNCSRPLLLLCLKKGDSKPSFELTLDLVRYWLVQILCKWYFSYNTYAHFNYTNIESNHWMLYYSKLKITKKKVINHTTCLKLIFLIPQLYAYFI